MRIRDYELLIKLGQGGMGAVYKARHARLKREVAVKVMTTLRAHDPYALARFEREMEAIGRLDHPNIVRATDAGEFNGLHYLVMEYVEGCDVSTLAMLAKPMSVADACEIARQAAIGLQHAFENGQVHRDMKPSNLMLTEDGTVKILDMGLARVAGAESDATRHSELTGTGQILGTIDYMAPEQAHDTHAVDVRADIYSLGATLYRLLAGQSPFASHCNKLTLQRLQALTTEEPAPLTDLRDDLPKSLVRLLERIMNRNPDDRPQQPIEVADALSEFTTAADLLDLLERTSDDRAAIRDSFGSDISVGFVNELSQSDPTAHGNSLSTDSLLTSQAQTVLVQDDDHGLPLSESSRVDVLETHHRSAKLVSVLGLIGCLAVATVLLVLRPWDQSDPDSTSSLETLKSESGTSQTNKEVSSISSTKKEVSDENVIAPVVHSEISSDQITISDNALSGQMRFTRQGNLAVCGWDIALWDVSKAIQLEHFKHPTLNRRVGGGVNNIAFAPDGSRFVTSSWSAKGQVHLDLFELPEGVRELD